MSDRISLYMSRQLLIAGIAKRLGAELYRPFKLIKHSVLQNMSRRETRQPLQVQS